MQLFIRIYLVGWFLIWICYANSDELDTTEAITTVDLSPSDLVDSETTTEIKLYQKDTLPCSYRALCNQNLSTEADIKCGCDPSCHKYNTCCRDVYDPRLIPSQTFECIDIEETLKYVTTRCPHSFDVTAIRDLCLTPLSEIVVPVPNLEEWFVSSNKTGYRYRNIYCAICNGEDLENMEYMGRTLACLELSEKMNYTEEEKEDQGLEKSWTMLAGFGPCIAIWKHSNYSKECERMVSLCPINMSDNSLTCECHHGPMEAIQDNNGTWYRNDACMKCNGVFESGLCRNIPSVNENITHITPDMYWLQFLVRPAGETCSSPNAEKFYLSKDDVCKVKSCKDGEILNWQTKSCQPICPLPLLWINGKCQTTACSFIGTESFRYIYKKNESFINFTSESVELVTESVERLCYSCHWHKLLSEEVQFNVNHIEWYEINETIYYAENGLEKIPHKNSSICYLCARTDIHREAVRKEQNILYVVIDYHVFKIVNPLYYFVNETLVKVCSSKHSPSEHFKVNSSCDKLSDTVISSATITVSMASLAVMIGVYILLPELHNVAGFLVLNQAASLLLGYIFFLLRGPSATDRAGCYVTAVFTHYFFLTSYFWSFLFAVEVFQGTKPFHRPNNKSLKRLCRYSSVGWIVPFLPSLVAIILDHKTETTFYDVKDRCWLSSPDALHYCFIIPIAVIFALNTIFYVIVLIRFAVLAYKSRELNIYHKEKVILSLKLVIAFGLLWIFGILAAFTQDDTLACIFTFTNGLSGLALMVVFVCNKSTFKGLSDLIRKKMKKVDTTCSSTDKTTESSPLNGNAMGTGNTCLEKTPLTAISKNDPVL